MGLQGMINDLLRQCDFAKAAAGDRQGDPRPGPTRAPATIGAPSPPRDDPRPATNCAARSPLLAEGKTGGKEGGARVPVLGITRHRAAPASRAWSKSSCAGSSPTSPTRRFAVISVDPSKRKSGGALLGDRSDERDRRPAG